jgi:hypothetical protein
MDESLFLAQRYFSSPRDHWWRWDAEGRFLEFASGKSIAPRQQLLSLVESLAENGLPPMDALVLFILSTHQHPEEYLHELQQHPALLQTLTEMKELGLLSPGETFSRQSAAADYLFTKLGQRGSRGEAEEIVDRMRDLDFSSLRSDEERKELKQDLIEKLKCLDRPEAGQAELHQITGYERLPEAKALEVDFPGGIRHLLQDMKGDQNWAALERLTQQALSAISLPKRLSEKQDIPDGGYQDITNRGDLDRLLPGELAHEDEMLLLRLSQGEALFLEREYPPHQPSQREWLILDNGLRMWGEPKLLGLASALAIGLQQEAHQHLELLRPCGEGLEPVSLLTRDGLLDYLFSTESHLECPASMSEFVEEHPNDTVMLLTEKRCLHGLLEQGGFPTRSAPLYLLLVDHRGYLSLEQWSRSGLKKLRHAQLDLEDFIPHASERDLPAQHYPLYALRPCPVRLPFDTENPLCLRLERNIVLSSTERVQLAEWRQDQTYPRILHIRPEARVPIGMGLIPTGKLWIVQAHEQADRVDWTYLEMDPRNGEVLTEQLLERGHAIDRNAFCGFLDTQLLIVQSGKAMTYEPYSGAKTGEFESSVEEHVCQHFYSNRFKKQWSRLVWNRGLKLEAVPNIPEDTLALIENSMGRFRVTLSYHVLQQEGSNWNLKFSGMRHQTKANEGPLASGPDGQTLRWGDFTAHFELGKWEHISQFKLLTAKRLGLRAQFKGIYLDGQRFGILNRKGNVQEFMFTERCELSQGKFQGHQHGHLFVKSPLSGTREILFPNGSRILQDENHVLHLLPADPECPSLSLIIVQQFFVGCSETGDYFGHHPFLAQRPGLDPQQTRKLFAEVLEALQ